MCVSVYSLCVNVYVSALVLCIGCGLLAWAIEDQCDRALRQRSARRSEDHADGVLLVHQLRQAAAARAASSVPTGSHQRI